MTGDKFRSRAYEYIESADAVTDPVRKLALMDAAERWLRLAAEIDGASSRNSAASGTPARAGVPTITAV